MSWRRPWWRSACVLLAGLVAAGCARRDATAGGAVRLIDEVAAATFEGEAPATTPPPPTAWRFGPADATPAAPTAGWRAGAQVAELAVRDGLLAGRTVGAFPLLHLERTSGLDNPDQVHAVEVRLRVSAGSTLWVLTSAAEKVDLASVQALGRRQPLAMSTPLEPGEELRTYTLVPGAPLQGLRVRHLMLVPTDVANASFAVESVRLVFRREHLAGIASGVGWQGLRDVYRETIVARSPQTIRFATRLPERPWLDLAVGTIEARPVSFQVRVERRGGGAAAVESRLTVTTAHRWEPMPVDLESLAGETVTITLALASDPAGGLGFWGAPVIRTRWRPAEARRAPDPARPRGVVLIQADTLRRDHLDVYGHDRPTAPTLAAMARQGVLFRHAVSQATWTKVSTPSILASLYPSTHGVRVFADRLPASATTVAEAYRDAGFATLALSSVPFVGQYTNLHQGFEELHESASLPNRGGPLTSKTAREHVDRLLGWLERHRETPFFVFLHVFDPHHPYEPYPPFGELWVEPATREEHLRQREAATPLIADEFMKVRQLPSREEVERAGFDPETYVAVERAWYDASIRAMDVEVGRLLERLAAWGLADDTLVVLTSDHGTEFFDHGAFWHGQSVYGELTDVPLVVRWPRAVAAGRVIDELVQTIDVAPTLLAASGLARPATFQGQSLMPFLAAGGRPAADGAWPGWRRRPAFTERAPLSPDQPPPRNRTSYAVVDGDWKLVHHAAPDPPADELYAWRTDPLNQQDVAGRHPDVVARLGATLAAWRREAEAARLPADAEAAKDLGPEDLQRLRSLGYLR